MPASKPTVLCILDGWGLRPEIEGNAVAQANTPNFDALMANNPSSTLITYGPDVGLPKGQMGNSEVGHMNIGAGRVVEMDLRKIEGAIERGEFAKLDGILRFIDAVKVSGGRAHLCGVLSDGGVHSHIDHMIETANTMSDAGLDVLLHLFSDGRDVPPKSAMRFLDKLEQAINKTVKIATLSGRYYALDRDNRWERVSKAYDTIVKGVGETSQLAYNVIGHAYDAGITDEFILPTVIADYDGLIDNDGLMFLNFRADRAREILSAIGDPKFNGFETGPRPKLAILSGFAQYSTQHDTFLDCIFPKADIVNTLGAWVAAKGLRQFRIAETEKYPHVTFFLNGGIEKPEEGEERYLAPSPMVATYDFAA